MPNQISVDEDSPFTNFINSNPGATLDDAVQLGIKVWDTLDADVTRIYGPVAPSTVITDMNPNNADPLNLATIQFAAHFSKLFGIIITAAELGKCTTFGDLADLICTKNPKI